ncbi:hypothetical protein ACWEOI_25490 [Nocardia sp. NPDC004340]
MPQRGDFHDLDASHSQAERAFAQAIQELIRLDGRGLRTIAPEVHLSKSALGNLARAKCKLAPDDAEHKTLLALYELASNAVGASSIPFTWEELLRRRLALSSTPYLPGGCCVSCGTNCSACNPPSDAAEQPTSMKPATGPANSDISVVPVPSPDGDRHNTAFADVAWPAAYDVIKIIATDDFPRLGSILRHVGMEAPAVETASAIRSFSDMDMPDVVASIISHAARRRDRDVLHVLHALSEVGKRTEADSLLRRVIADESM